LLLVDQFEELLTQTRPEERARFVELLQEALAGPVQVVATLRPEFLDQLLASPGGRPGKRPDRAATRRRGPARVAGSWCSWVPG
jgi:hypothetical protein